VYDLAMGRKLLRHEIGCRESELGQGQHSGAGVRLAHRQSVLDSFGGRTKQQCIRIGISKITDENDVVGQGNTQNCSE